MSPVHAASLQKLEQSAWTVSGLPSYVNMDIYVPDKLHTFGPSEAGTVRAIVPAISANVVPGTPMNVKSWIGEFAPDRLLLLMWDDKVGRASRAWPLTAR